MPAQNKDDGGWKKFFWNSDTRECLGRTGGSWGKNSICFGDCKESLLQIFPEQCHVFNLYFFPQVSAFQWLQCVCLLSGHDATC